MALLNNQTQISILVEGLDHPEGVAWGLDGYLYAGGEDGQIYRINPTNHGIKEIANLGGGFVAGLALDANNNIYACHVDTHSVKMITPDGMVSTYSNGSSEYPFRIPNYPVFDNAGNLYVSDSGDFDFSKSTGNIVKIPTGGGPGIIWEDRLKEFPNGMCLSPTKDALYVVSTFTKPGVYRIDFQSNGDPGNINTVVELPDASPDGVAFDTEGNLYISCYRPDRIYRLDPHSNLDIFAEDTTGHLLAAPTNIAFYGANLSNLASANLGRWHITKYNSGKNGVPLEYPKIH